jgi:hypothetical protein
MNPFAFDFKLMMAGKYHSGSLQVQRKRRRTRRCKQQKAAATQVGFRV